MGPLSLSVKGEYALLAMLDLALQPESRPVKIAAIARRQKIPQKFLELILAGLKQGGFVESRRGAEGGYLLARPPQGISVGELLRYVEGGRKGRPGRTSAESPFGSMWTRVDQAVNGILDSTTVAEVAQTWREQRLRYVPNWEI